MKKRLFGEFLARQRGASTGGNNVNRPICFWATTVLVPDVVFMAEASHRGELGAGEEHSARHCIVGQQKSHPPPQPLARSWQ